ncbi:MAG: peptide chain release factor 1 [Gammaproteobacteria bacterium]|uniref:Peptide chain release factor 1 n=1 Tax=SAR86 cluster bacterium TaxID=2030880 RepID=A0A368BQL4_9GAMM|nr:MAG: peptide chain release factor 1 [SAR86 cluster bacterium]
MLEVSIINKLESLRSRSNEIYEALAKEGATNDMANFTQLNKEHAEISPIVDLFKLLQDTESELLGAKELLDSGDLELVELAKIEVATNQDKILELEKSLKFMLLPKDHADDGAAYLEIRAGAGGDEAAIFAADLFRMYSRLSERQGWKLEIVNIKQSEPSGLKEVVVKINGQGVFKFLKFESGVHRVQRVPETESQGRIHTSTVTVAILPEVDEVQDIEIDKSELRVDTYRASGAGGQHVNKTDSAVRLTHIPSGVVVECQDDRSQHKNKAKAMALLAAKLKQNEIDEQQNTIASERKILVGTGDRSEKIRTYNFPQGRITDHRIKLTQHNLDQVMDGDMISICQALITENQLAQLSNLEESS